MSNRTDRTIRDNRMLIVVSIAMLVIIAVGGGYVWWRMNGGAPQQQIAGPGSMPTSTTAIPSASFTVTVYLPLDGMLAAGSAAVKLEPDTQSQAREALAALWTDPRSAQAAVLKDVKLRALYLDAAGTAYIDLGTTIPQDIRASTGEELLALYALADTVMQNFDEVKRVRFLVNGREAHTLAGHIDLSEKFEKRMDLVKP